MKSQFITRDFFIFLLLLLHDSLCIVLWIFMHYYVELQSSLHIHPIGLEIKKDI